jgi:hypothetical protein
MQQPIVCTLNPAEMRDRGARVDALAADALLSREPIEGGLRHRFRADDAVERELRDLAALESRCCAFLTFAVSRDPHAVVLDVTGAPDAQPVIEQFFLAA